MSANKIDELLAEVQRLRDATEPVDEKGAVKAANLERDQAVSSMNRAIDERNKAVKELGDVKAAVQWTMGKLRISDVIMMRSEQMPAAADGWLNGFNQDPQDWERIAWINRCGRMSLADQHILFSLPHQMDPEVETFPEVYNFRHFVDLCRKTYRPRIMPAP